MSTTTVDQNDDEQQTPTDAQETATRNRSFALLGELVSPVKGQFAVMALMVVVAQLAVVAGPAIIAWGINVGLPELIAGNPTPAIQAAALTIGAAIVGGILTFGYVRQSVVVGQKMLLALRRRVFRFTQRQDLEFHESYTSGRIVSRQTSDMEALRELLDSGVNVMVGASLAMVFTIVLIVKMDWVTGVV
ncbi:MAG: ABC transporter transmembrane domain-containing protein, partial [Brachybacterium tyrofermentans]